jgi:predicted dithiol-disulfide oxidoreductase (DUF899 family)
MAVAEQTTPVHAVGGPAEEGLVPIRPVKAWVRRDGKIRHFWSSELFLIPSDPGEHPRHVDFVWPLWKILDTTPDGRGTDWSPALEY